MSETDKNKSENKEPEVLQPVSVDIRGKVYKLPEHLEYQQYYLVSKLIDKADVDFTQFFNFSANKANNLKVGMEVLKFLNMLIKADILPEFFSMILLPVKEDGTLESFDVEKSKTYEDDMRRMTDIQIMEVGQSFFIGRGVLMAGGLTVLQGFKELKNP